MQTSGHAVSVSFFASGVASSFLFFLQIAQAVGVDNHHSARNMFPNREQFGRPIGPMGFAINTAHSPPLPPPPPPIFALPAQPTIHQSPPPPPTQPQASLTGWTPTRPPPGSFCSPFTTVHRVTDIDDPPHFSHSGHIHPASAQPAEPDDNTPEPGIPRRRGTLGCQSWHIRMPVEQVPVMAIIRHGWSSYWLRYLSNGQEMFPVMSKSIADAVLASELLSMIRQRKINTDAAATAYAWEHSLPMDRASAVKALAEDFCDYMEDLIHKRQVANNASNSAQQTMGTPAAVQAAAQGANPASSHRITQLEVQLAKAQHTVRRLQTNAPGQVTLTPGHSAAEPAGARGSTIQEQIDRLTQEVGPSEPILPQITENEVVEIPHSGIPRHRYFFAIWKMNAGAGRTESGGNPTQPKEEADVYLAWQHAANIRRSSINSRDRGIGLHSSPSKEVAASHAHRQTKAGSETGRRDLQRPRAALGMVYC